MLEIGSREPVDPVGDLLDAPVVRPGEERRRRAAGPARRAAPPARAAAAARAAARRCAPRRARRRASTRSNAPSNARQSATGRVEREAVARGVPRAAARPRRGPVDRGHLGRRARPRRATGTPSPQPSSTTRRPSSVSGSARASASPRRPELGPVRHELVVRERLLVEQRLRLGRAQQRELDLADRIALLDEVQSSASSPTVTPGGSSPSFSSASRTPGRRTPRARSCRGGSSASAPARRGSPPGARRGPAAAPSGSARSPSIAAAVALRGARRRVELRRVVELDDLGRVEVARRLGGEAHHQHGADREVRREEDRHAGLARRRVHLGRVPPARADDARDAGRERAQDVRHDGRRAS